MVTVFVCLGKQINSFRTSFDKPSNRICFWIVKQLKIRPILHSQLETTENFVTVHIKLLLPRLPNLV